MSAASGRPARLTRPLKRDGTGVVLVGAADGGGRATVEGAVRAAGAAAGLRVGAASCCARPTPEWDFRERHERQAARNSKDWPFDAGQEKGALMCLPTLSV